MFISQRRQIGLFLSPVFLGHVTLKGMFGLTVTETQLTLISLRLEMFGFKMELGFSIGGPGLKADQTLSHSVS